MIAKSHSPRWIQRIQKQLGARIKKLREKKGVTRTELAKACRLRPSHLGEIKRGNHNIRLSSLKRITRELDITIEHMLRRIL